MYDDRTRACVYAGIGGDMDIDCNFDGNAISYANCNADVDAIADSHSNAYSYGDIHTIADTGARSLRRDNHRRSDGTRLRRR